MSRPQLISLYSVNDLVLRADSLLIITSIQVLVSIVSSPLVPRSFLTIAVCLPVSPQNYNQACLTPATCQSQILNIDSGSSVSIYSLSTVATTFQLSVSGQGIINQSGNINGFAATVTAWSRTWLGVFVRYLYGCTSSYFYYRVSTKWKIQILHYLYIPLPPFWRQCSVVL